MNFKSKNFIHHQTEEILDFYIHRIIDKDGGYYQNIKRDGTVFEPEYKHLVSTCRFIYNFSRATEYFKDSQYAKAAIHGYEHLQKVHFLTSKNTYAWKLHGQIPIDDSPKLYGLAFVLLALSSMHKAEIEDLSKEIKHTVELMDHYFWLENDGLYGDEVTSGESLHAYRGQNSNMHACEAFIDAYEATKDEKYLQRAYRIARNITQNLTTQTNGLVWEHYHSDWSVDWTYNQNYPKSPFKPWGYQPGHQFQWSKYLIKLSHYFPEKWMLPKAESLFRKTISCCWDLDHGGIYYSMQPDMAVSDSDKYFWVQTEAIAAAAFLANKTGNKLFWRWYDKVWQYAWEHFIDHINGGWLQILTRDNQIISSDKATAGAKSDYHTLGAYFDLLQHL